MRRLVPVLLSVGVAGGALLFVSAPLVVSAATFRQCSDDSHISRNWTHGDPNTGLPPKTGYYYLDITACSTHLLGRVQVTSVGNPPRDPAGENVTWGFEIKHGYDPGNIASGSATAAGNSIVEFRFDNAIVGEPYRFRIANHYDEVVTDHATFDSVTCSTCTQAVSAPPPPSAPSAAAPQHFAASAGLPGDVAAAASSSNSAPTASPSDASSPVADSESDRHATKSKDNNAASTGDSDVHPGGAPASSSAALNAASAGSRIALPALLASAAAGVLAGLALATRLLHRRRRPS